MGLLHRSREVENIAESEPVDRFFEYLEHAEADLLLALSAAWRAVEEQAREEAWTRVHDAAKRTRTERGVETVRDRAMHWAGRSGYSYGEITAYGGGQPLWGDVRRQAAPALVDAAVAIALGRRLDSASREVLLGPWIAATGLEA